MFAIPLFGILDDGACTCSEGASCKAPGKHPRAKYKGLKSPPPIPKGANVAYVTGSASGVWVLDVDVKDGRNGFASVALLEDIIGEPIPDTRMARSPSGGVHFYFRWDATRPPVLNSVGELGEGLDVRGESKGGTGGLIVAPPSKTPKGEYTWANAANHPIADAPPALYDLINRARIYSKRAKLMIPGGAGLEGGRNNALIRWAGWLRGSEGLEGPLLEWAVGFANRTRLNPPLDAEEVGRILSSIESYPAGPKGREGGPLPDILLTHKLEEITAAGVEALGRDPQLYERGGELVQGTAEGRIVPHNRHTLRVRLASVAAWWRSSGKGGEDLLRVEPPYWVADALLGRGSFPGVRPLRGVVDTAYLSPSGGILDHAGYSPETGLLLVKDDPFEPMRLEDAKGALEEVVSEFPFEGPADKCAWFAFVLSLLSRWAHRGNIPMYFAEAPRPAAGKSKLVSCALIIAGHATTRKPFSRESEEQRKNLTRVARSGERICFFDDLAGYVESEALTIALTSHRQWNDRILGSSSSYDGPLETIFCGSGNACTVKEDLRRRMLVSSIVPMVEKPALWAPKGGYRHPNLEEWVTKEAGRLRRAGLSILQGFMRSGESGKPLPPWASMEEWSEIVRGACVWAGWGDPIEASGESRENAAMDGDEADAELDAVLEYIMGKGGGSATDIFRAYSSTLARDRKETEGLRAHWGRTVVTVVDVGRRLGRWRNRVRGGRVLRQVRHGLKGRTWTVEGVTDPSADDHSGAGLGAPWGAPPARGTPPS